MNDPVAADVVALTRELVEIDSVNPSLVADGAGEGAVARTVAGWADRNGLTAEITETTAGRPSVIVRGGRADGGRRLLLCGHLDTVGVEGMVDPLIARIDGDRLYGRGSYDMKRGVAAALVACREATRSGLAGEVVVACVADEEHASIGVRECLVGLQADGAVVTEPTELALVVAHKGFSWIEIAVEGVAAHGSRPHLGVDAILKAGPILTALAALDVRLATAPHPLLGRGSLHASLIEGGRELSTYPDRCVLQVERRSLPGEGQDAIERELAALLARCRTADPDLRVTGRVTLTRDPFAVDASAPLVELLRDAATAAIGATPPTEAVGYWTDAAFIAAAGIPTVLFGPAGEGAHAAVEWVDVPSLVTTTRTLVSLAGRFCGSRPA